MNLLEIIGTAIGILYLILEYRASAWLWLAGIIMPAIYIFVYYDAGLYADLGISVYYVVASVYGAFCWLSHKSKTSASDTGGRICRMPRASYLPLAGIFLLLFVAIGLLLSHLTDSTVPWWDSFTTSLSIVAMWMLARKYIEQWWAWMVADIGCSALYAYKGLWFTSALYLAYAIIAIFGYYKWKHELD